MPKTAVVRSFLVIHSLEVSASITCISSRRMWSRSQIHCLRAACQTTLTSSIDFGDFTSSFFPFETLFILLTLSWNKMTEQSALLLRKQLAGKWLTVSVNSTNHLHFVILTIFFLSILSVLFKQNGIVCNVTHCVSVCVRAYGLLISTCKVIRSEGLASMLAE